MAYTVTNFKTKKELKLQVELNKAFPNTTTPIRCYQPGLGPDLSNYTGKITLEGPHKWYAQAELVNGIVVKVS